MTTAFFLRSLARSISDKLQGWRYISLKDASELLYHRLREVESDWNAGAVLRAARSFGPVSYLLLDYFGSLIAWNCPIFGKRGPLMNKREPKAITRGHISDMSYSRVCHAASLIRPVSSDSGTPVYSDLIVLRSDVVQLAEDIVAGDFY